MTSKKRVLAACAFLAPDRIPRFDSFWQYPDSWRAQFGDPGDLTDIAIWCPEEGAFPTRARRIIELGRHGGVVIGTHSISPEIPLENFAAYHHTCLEFGNFQEGSAHEDET